MDNFLGLNLVVINIKPSDRVRKKFVAKFPDAKFFGSATLGSKSKSYYIPFEVYEANKEIIKTYGSKSKHQPFLKKNLN